MDTTPATTAGQATQNSTTTNSNRQEESNLVQDKKTSSLTRVKQKDIVNPAARDTNDKSQDDKQIIEKKSSFKITVKTRTVNTDDKADEKPVRETKPDVTLGTTNITVNDKLPYDKHQQSSSRNQESKPDVTMGTHIHDNRVPSEPQPSRSRQAKPDVTMVTGSPTKPSTLPRDASTSKPPSGVNSIGNYLGQRASSDANIAGKTGKTRSATIPRTSGNISHTGSGAKSPGVTPDTNTSDGDNKGVDSGLNDPMNDGSGLPKSTKTRHAPAPPLSRSSGSLSRTHEPADTSGYPDSFSKRSRSSRENILDVVAAGRLGRYILYSLLRTRGATLRIILPSMA